MSEVHRYQVVTMLSASGATIGYDPLVMASAFDEATRLFLDAAERCVAAERRENELQQRLTAADELADTMGGLLRLARGAIGENQWTLLTKDIDTMLSQDAQLTNKSGNAHCPHDGICHTSEETCAEAQARIESLTATAGADQ